MVKYLLVIQMKKIRIYILLIVTFFSLALFACKNDDHIDKAREMVVSLIPMQVKGDFTLLDNYNDVVITYTSSNSEVLAIDGKLASYMMPEKDEIVTITATFTYKNNKETKDIIVIVSKYEHDETNVLEKTIDDYKEEVEKSINEFFESIDFEGLKDDDIARFNKIHQDALESIKNLSSELEIDEVARSFYDDINNLKKELALKDDIDVSDASLISYYDGVDLNLRGTSMLLSLRKLITDTHTTITSYDDLKKYTIRTDRDPSNSNNIILIYSKASVKGTWDGGSTWNREHVWPQSKGWFKTSGAGSDIHHLRPEDPGVNSSRGNKAFGPLTNSYYYCPQDSSKGDVARIIFYLLVRYPESENYPITNVAYSMEMLLEWNELDPVDNLEKNRNEEAYSIQGNRNPFIDYAKFATIIWDYKKDVSKDSEIVIIIQINYCIIDNKNRFYEI